MATHKTSEAYRRIQDGEITIRELKGITSEEMSAGVQASRRLMEAGKYMAAAEVLSGLALYDPFQSDIWRALEELFRRQLQPEAANLFADLARVMTD